MFHLKSRIHRLENLTGDADFFSGFSHDDVWVMRDDELGGFWGSKLRKYAGIIDHCRKHAISHILATGGVNSNNLAAAAALCTEAGLTLTVFAVSDFKREVSGNKMLLQLLLPPERIILFDRQNKDSIPDSMTTHKEVLERQGANVLILSEGGGCIPAVVGSISLADAVLGAFEGMLPAHLFIDSGTALSAASLAAGLVKAGQIKDTRIHVVQMAGAINEIETAFSQWVQPATGVRWSEVSDHVTVHTPLSPRSYGATNAQLFAFIRWFTRKFGILLDPIYSAKLFMKSLAILEADNIQARSLIIHTGGLSGLMGYGANDILGLMP